jgi:hypothetical protein
VRKRQEEEEASCLRPLLGAGPESCLRTPALLRALIHRSAWNRISANFAFTEFSEVGFTPSLPPKPPPGLPQLEFLIIPIGSLPHGGFLPHRAGVMCHQAQMGY